MNQKFSLYKYRKTSDESVWVNKEQAFLDCMRNIVKTGIKKTERNRYFISFDNTLKYNLQETFPLLTTKRMFIRF